MTDNASSLESKFSNIKITFLPAIQLLNYSLDLGTIQNFEVHYKCLLLCYALTKIYECQTASEVVKSVNILIGCPGMVNGYSADNIKVY